jgi:flavodoxin
MKNLIVYYSRKGENYYGNGLKQLEKGNTEIAAEIIQKAVGGELFEIEPVKPYPFGYRACVEKAKEELRQNARPAIKRFAEDISQYDTVFVGYPSWCSTCPMCVFTFLEHYDLSGRRIVPFCTNEGSGMGNSERDLRKACAGAVVESGLSIRGCQAADSETVISAWAKEKAGQHPE